MTIRAYELREKPPARTRAMKISGLNINHADMRIPMRRSMKPTVNWESLDTVGS